MLEDIVRDREQSIAHTLREWLFGGASLLLMGMTVAPVVRMMTGVSLLEEATKLLLGAF